MLNIDGVISNRLYVLEVGTFWKGKVYVPSDAHILNQAIKLLVYYFKHFYCLTVFSIPTKLNKRRRGLLPSLKFVNMASEKGLTELEAMFNIATKYKLLPFNWNSKLCKITPLTGWFEKAPAYLVSLIFIFQVTFGIINFYIQLPKLSTQTTVLYLFWNLMFLAASVCSIQNLKQNSEYIIAMNHFFGTYRLMLGQHISINKTLTWKLKANVLSFAVIHHLKFCALETLALVIYFMGHSNKVWYISSHFELNWLIFSIFVLLEYTQLFLVLSTLLSSTIPIMLCWFCMATWMGSLR